MGLSAHKAYNSAWCSTSSKNPLRPLMYDVVSHSLKFGSVFLTYSWESKIVLLLNFPVLYPTRKIVWFFIGCNFESRASQAGLHKQKKDTASAKKGKVSLCTYQCKSRGSTGKGKGFDAWDYPLCRAFDRVKRPRGRDIWLWPTEAWYQFRRLPSLSLEAFWKSRCWRKVWSFHLF